MHVFPFFQEGEQFTTSPLLTVVFTRYALQECIFVEVITSGWCYKFRFVFAVGKKELSRLSDLTKTALNRALVLRSWT